MPLTSKTCCLINIKIHPTHTNKSNKPFLSTSLSFLHHYCSSVRMSYTLWCWNCPGLCDIEFCPLCHPHDGRGRRHHPLSMCSCHDVIMMLYSCRILSCLAAELHDAAFTSCLIYSNDRLPAGRKRFPVVIIHGLGPVFFFVVVVAGSCNGLFSFQVLCCEKCNSLSGFKTLFHFFSFFFSLCRLDGDNGFFGSAL